MKYPVTLLLLLLLFQQNSAQISRRSNNNPRNSEFIIVSEDSSRISKSMFPLAKGNLFQYLGYSDDQYAGAKKYSLGTKEITDEIIINNKKYYTFNGSRGYRYDADSNKLYIGSTNGFEALYYDFSLPRGEMFKAYNPYSNIFETIIVSSDTGYSFGRMRRRVFDQRVWVMTMYRDTYAEGLGIINSSENPAMGPYYSFQSNLINALIYDENGKYTYYTQGYKPRLTVTPFDAVKGDTPEVTFSCTAKHNYDNQNSSYGVYSDGVVYIDNVRMAYFYKKGNDSTSVMTVYASRVNIDGKYTFKINIDTSLIRNGYDFMYRITAKDKALIPQYTSWPENGYHKAVYDPLLQVNDNLNKAGYFSLEQNYPNPFNPSTTIRYSIAVKGPVKMLIYNSLGQEFKILVNEQKDPGQYYAVFNADQLSSGIYFCRLSSGNSVLTRKMILLK